MNYSVFNPNYCNSIPATMKINGMGKVKGNADTAVVSLGIITENNSLEAAQKENAIKSNDVIDKMLQLGVPKENIATSSYNIDPQYDYVEGKQTFRGYRVSNILSVTITDLSRVGEVIDEATKSGVNSVNNVEFNIRDKSFYYSKALNLAIKDAQIKAREVSRTLGVKLIETPYKIIEETSTGISQENNMLKAVAASTPIMPGPITIIAAIEAYFYY